MTYSQDTATRLRALADAVDEAPDGIWHLGAAMYLDAADLRAVLDELDRLAEENARLTEALQRLAWAAEQADLAHDHEARCVMAVDRIHRDDDPKLYDQRADAYAAAASSASQNESWLRSEIFGARQVLKGLEP